MSNEPITQKLAIALCNLELAADALEALEENRHHLSPEANAQLSLVHVGLAMALDGLEQNELHRLVSEGEREMGGSAPF